MSLRFNASKVTPSEFADGEYLPLPASKGPAFPFPSAPPFGLSSGSKTQDKLCSPSMGTPPFQQITLRNNGVTLKNSGNFRKGIPLHSLAITSFMRFYGAGAQIPWSEHFRNEI